MKNGGIGHKNSKQLVLFKTNWKHQLSHGGVLRNKRAGRGQRPLSCKEPLHLVFKLDSSRLRHRSLRSYRGFALTQKIIRKYSSHFAVKVEQLSIQNDHIHALVRTSRRSQYQHFFRVVAGQIAQRFEKEGLLLGSLTGVTGTPQNPQTWHKALEVPAIYQSDSRVESLQNHPKLYPIE